MPNPSDEKPLDLGDAAGLKRKLDETAVKVRMHERGRLHQWKVDLIKHTPPHCRSLLALDTWKTLQRAMSS